jgi:hypothetical protein
VSSLAILHTVVREKFFALKNLPRGFLASAVASRRRRFPFHISSARNLKVDQRLASQVVGKAYLDVGHALKVHSGHVYRLGKSRFSTLSVIARLAKSGD